MKFVVLALCALLFAGLFSGCGTSSAPTSSLVGPKPAISTPSIVSTPLPSVQFDSRGEVIPPTGAELSATNGIAFVPDVDQMGLGMTKGGPGSTTPTYCKFDGSQWVLAPGQYYVFIDTFASARKRGGVSSTVDADFAFKNASSTQVLNSSSASQHVLGFNYAGNWTGGATFAVGNTLQYCTTSVKVLTWEEVGAQPILSLQLKNHVDSSSWNSYHESNILLSARDANGFIEANTAMALVAVVQVDNIYTVPARGGSELGGDYTPPSLLWDEAFVSGRNFDNSLAPSFHFTGGYSSEGVGNPFAFDTGGKYAVVVNLLKNGRIIQSLTEYLNLADAGGKGFTAGN